MNIFNHLQAKLRFFGYAEHLTISSNNTFVNVKGVANELNLSLYDF